MPSSSHASAGTSASVSGSGVREGIASGRRTTRVGTGGNAASAVKHRHGANSTRSQAISSWSGVRMTGKSSEALAHRLGISFSTFATRPSNAKPMTGSSRSELSNNGLADDECWRPSSDSNTGGLDVRTDVPLPASNDRDYGFWMRRHLGRLPDHDN